MGDHSVRRYDEELEAIRSRVLQMGGLVESQVRLALDALQREDPERARQAIEADRRVDDLEVELDQMVIHLIARRQPTAGDLRMITGVGKAVTEIERIGDEATRIARAVGWLRDRDSGVPMPRGADLTPSGDIALAMLQRTLDAFARVDAEAAAAIIRDDRGVDDRFRATLRQLVTFMMEDPRTISAALDVVWAAKAIERIGDHARNIAGHIIFIAQGVDTRHLTPEQMERALAR